MLNVLDVLKTMNSNQKVNYDKILKKMIDRWQVESKRPKILLHSCCAPCSTYTLEYLNDFADITIYFANSNIHPRSEYERRKIVQQQFVAAFNDKTDSNVQFLAAPYEPNEFIRLVKKNHLEMEPEGGNRCASCFQMRLDIVARKASELNYDYFGSALTLDIDSSKVKNLAGGDKEFVVEGLDEAKKLTTEELEKHLVVNFNGVSGLGSATIDNTLPGELGYLGFTLVDDGKFKNGDLAKIEITEDLENRLADNGYLLDDDFDPSFEVKGLDEVAEKATDIANLDDIKRMIDEEVNRSYKDWNPEASYGSRYEIKEEGLFYRQFVRDSNDSQFSFNSATNNGNLVKILSVKRYYGGTENKLNTEFTAIIGFSDLFLDEENKVNVADLITIKDTKDSTYSVESVVQLYEGYGYNRVEE